MAMKVKSKYINFAFGLVLLASCSSHEEAMLPIDDDTQIIHIGNVSVDDMQVAATIRAEATTPSWLIEGLKDIGMNIVYDLGTSEQYALLKYDGSSYYMNLYGTDDKVSDTPAKWLGNGAHVFRGAYVPSDLRKENTTKKYDDLCKYTSLPPKHEIYATIDTVTIPTQHRLARVMAYVLIDNRMKNVDGSKTSLKGYGDDNVHEENTKLRFGNVDVLDYVDTNGRPHWKTVSKAVPHFLKEQNITVYKSGDKLVFPTDSEWEDASKNSSYEKIEYGTSPCYDIIVRPTYKVTTNKAMVMGDELDANNTDANSNKIEFELTLENDLEYEKTYSFDLNANDETVVYLRVSPEKIDYNSTGARLWKSESYGDDYYGVNNTDYELSMVGSSWQRAYTFGDYTHSVTDGKEYKEQYISDEDSFIALLKDAKENGTYEGRYFILQKDIAINLKDFPDYLVGHLDAMGHTITVVPDGDRNWLYIGLNSGWNSEILNAKIVGGVLFDPQTTIINGHVKNCWNGDTSIKDATPDLQTYKSEYEN